MNPQNPFRWPPEDDPQFPQSPPELYSKILHWEKESETVFEATVTRYGVRRLRSRATGFATVFAGNGLTDAGGRWAIDLTRTNCLESGRIWGEPYLVATPLSRSPVLITTSFELNDGYLLIEIHSWHTNGEKAGAVLFNWHCVVSTTVDLI